MDVELELLLISANHPPNPELTAVEKIRTNMKRNARYTYLTTNNISANIAGGN